MNTARPSTANSNEEKCMKDLDFIVGAIKRQQKMTFKLTQMVNCLQEFINEIPKGVERNVKQIYLLRDFEEKERQFMKEQSEWNKLTACRADKKQPDKQEKK